MKKSDLQKGIAHAIAELRDISASSGVFKDEQVKKVLARTRPDLTPDLLAKELNELADWIVDDGVIAQTIVDSTFQYWATIMSYEGKDVAQITRVFCDVLQLKETGGEAYVCVADGMFGNKNVEPRVTLTKKSRERLTQIQQFFIRSALNFIHTQREPYWLDGVKYYRTSYLPMVNLQHWAALFRPPLVLAWP